MSYHDLAQYLITFMGVAILALTVCPEAKWRRWGYVVGLLSEPAWFYAAWESGLWGVFILSSVYTIGWIYGIYSHFFGPQSHGTKSKTRSRTAKHRCRLK